MWIIVAILVSAAGAAGFVPIVAHLYKIRRPDAPPVYVVMQRDPVTEHVEVWTTYETHEAAAEAIHSLRDVYEGTKVFWLAGDREPETLPEPPHRVIPFAEPFHKLIPLADPWVIVTRPGVMRDPIQAARPGEYWEIAERFSSREAALEALMTRYPVGCTARRG